MKKLFCFAIAALTAIGIYAAPPGTVPLSGSSSPTQFPVIVDTNGTVLSPTNWRGSSLSLGAITNGQGTNVVQAIARAAVTNLPVPAGVFTNIASYDSALATDTNAAYFFNTLAANPIVRTKDRESVAGFVAELKRGGLFNNLVDACFLKTNLGASTTRLVTLMGRTNATMTNITYSSFGAVFDGSTSMANWAIPDTRTNIIVLVFRRPGLLSNTAQSGSPCGIGLFGGTGGTNSGNKFVVDVEGAPMMIDGGVQNPASPSATTIADQMTGEWWIADHQRRVGVISFNGTNAWTAYNGHTNLSTNFTISATAALTNLVIGMQPNSGAWNNPFKGEIAAWALFNVSNPTQAQLLAIEKACRWLEDSEENIVFIGDSLTKPTAVDEANFSNSDGSNTYTNGWPVYFMLAASQKGNVCWWDEAASGRTSSDYGSTGAWRPSVRTNDFVMHGIGGKVKKLKIFYLIGANDWIGGETNGTNVFNNLTNFTEEAKSYGAEVYVLTSGASGTNSSSPPSLWWTTSNETARQQFNTLLRINSGLFNGMFDRDLLFSVSDMATNLLNTADGLHLTKKGSRIQAQAVDGFFTGRPSITATYDESGNVVSSSTRVRGSVDNIAATAPQFSFPSGSYIRTNTDGSVFLWPRYEERSIASLMVVQGTVTSDSGGSLNYPEAVYQAASGALWLHFQPPWWATNMTISYMLTSDQTTTYWTNRFQEWYYDSLTGRGFGGAQDFGPINGGSSGIHIYTNSVTLDNTKNPKTLDWRFLAGTNTTGNRLLLSPVRIIWR